MKSIRWAISVLTAIALFVLCLLGSFRLIVFSRAYMHRELTKLNIAESVAMTQEDLDQVFDEILLCLEGKREDLVITTTVEGEVREAFNERERTHMEDVLALFRKGFILYYSCIAILAAGILLWISDRRSRRRNAYILGKSVVLVFSAFLILMLVLVGCMAIDFDACFEVFHQIIFTNDLWLMDPGTDLMINLVPEQFFYDTAMTIGGTFLGMSVLILVGAATLWRRLAGTERHE